ncbi:MAG: DUF2231 domain-containing protein [Bacteroidia bacterium]
MATAFFSALAASTIFHAMPSVDAPKAAVEIFEEHQKYAQLTLWMSGIALLLKSIGIFFKISRRLYEVIVLVTAIISAIFLATAGHHGARLTHVAGVGPMGRYLMKDHVSSHDEKEMEGMDMDGDSTTHMNDSMPGMDTMKGMKEMDNIKGMDKMKDMKNMPGMDKMKNMKDMPGMDTMKNMKDMDSTLKMEDMKNMNMPMKNPMDTFRFPDNNPARKKANKTD